MTRLILVRALPSVIDRRIPHPLHNSDVAHCEYEEYLKYQFLLHDIVHLAASLHDLLHEWQLCDQEKLSYQTTFKLSHSYQLTVTRDLDCHRTRIRQCHALHLFSC